LILLLVAIVALLNSKLFSIADFTSSKYILYSNFDEGLDTNKFQIDNKLGTYTIQNGNLLISADPNIPSQGSTSLKLTKDLSKFDVKITGILYGGSSYDNTYTRIEAKSCSLSFGANTIGSTSTTNTDFTIEGIHNFADSNEIGWILNGKVQLTSSPINPLYIKIQGAGRSGSASYPDYSPCQVSIEKIEYSPIFSCSLKNDEVYAQDTFQEGAIISLQQNSLTYELMSFCEDNPAYKRSFTQEGIKQDTFNTIFKRLQRGELITVPKGEAYIIPYITKFVEGMPSGCNQLGYGISKEGKCERIGYIEQKPIALSCSQVSDCFIPKNCQEIEVTCKNNFCNYNTDVCEVPTEKVIVINEILIYQEIIKNLTETKLIPVSTDNTFTFGFIQDYVGFKIGDKSFTNSISKVCDNSKDEKCFSFSINGISIPYGQEVLLDNYLNTICQKTGGVIKDDKIEGYKATCYFTLKNSFLSISDISQSNNLNKINLNIKRCFECYEKK